jgi:hypothetical protein
VSHRVHDVDVDVRAQVVVIKFVVQRKRHLAQSKHTLMITLFIEIVSKGQSCTANLHHMMGRWCGGNACSLRTLKYSTSETGHRVNQLTFLNWEVHFFKLGTQCNRLILLGFKRF